MIKNYKKFIKSWYSAMEKVAVKTLEDNMTYDHVQNFQISSFNIKVNCLNRKTTVL